MSRWRSKMISLVVGFLIGLLAFFVYINIAGLFVSKTNAPAQKQTSRAGGCGCAKNFASPDEVLAALQSTDVSTRREMHRRLFLQPGMTTAFYDYERDWNYPERAEQGKVQYVNLDDSPDPEALITFVRYESPVALVLKRDAECWQTLAALSSWLRFEDYPYDNWLELVE
ncbi:MAG: hypothetical protein LC754_09305, partial [Acidobacteria bacterium]|nr:hypothetical protein [Acidobacteriota bacterium]